MVKIFTFVPCSDGTHDDDDDDDDADADAKLSCT